MSYGVSSFNNYGIFRSRSVPSRSYGAHPTHIYIAAAENQTSAVGLRAFSSAKITPNASHTRTENMFLSLFNVSLRDRLSPFQ